MYVLPAFGVLFSNGRIYEKSVCVCVRERDRVLTKSAGAGGGVY